MNKRRKFVSLELYIVSARCSGYMYEVFKIIESEHVALLFYVHGKHLRSCRDGQLT